MSILFDFSDGNFAPEASGQGTLGTFANPWACGVFNEKIYFSNYQFRDSVGIAVLRNKLDNGYMPLRAQEFQGNPYGVGVTGSLVRFRDTGSITFSSTSTPTGTVDANISRKSAGIIQVGSGVSAGNNGTLALGRILLQCSDQPTSGFYITIDSNGTVSYQGPVSI